MACYKIEAYGDTVFVKAENEDFAFGRLTEVMGKMPRSIVTITEVDKLPNGEEYL